MPSYLTMDQDTRIQGSIMFKTGFIITKDGDNIIDCLNKKCHHSHNKNKNQDENINVLITENEMLLTTEDDKAILI